jgi:hypothetical protein
VESRGTAPAPGVRASDVDGWEVLGAVDGTMTSVYLDTTIRDATSPKEIELRWRAERERLEAAGASEAALRAIDDRIPGAHLRGASVALFARDDGAVVSFDLDVAVGADRSTVGPLPLLGPLVEWLQSHEPYVVAVCDHLGAEIVVVSRHGDDHEEVVGESDSTDRHLHLSQPGGWSQARFQRRAKGRWRANAGEAADRLVEIVAEAKPRFVAVAGDLRAVQMLREQLPESVRHLLHEVSGTRANDGSEVSHEELGRLIRTVVAEDTVTIAQKLSEELGQRDRGVVGAAATLAALAEARVDVLLVHDDANDARTAWFSADTMMTSVERADVEATGASEVREARLADAAIWHALHTGAAVRMTPTMAVLTDGIGGVLRH